MAAGFDVRNYTTAPGSERPEAMFTIQVLADPSYAEIDLAAAQSALTATYATASAELTKRVEMARSSKLN